MKPVRLTSLALAAALWSTGSAYSEAAVESPAEAETPVAAPSDVPKIELDEYTPVKARRAPDTVVADDAERPVDKTDKPAPPAPPKPGADLPVGEKPMGEKDVFEKPAVPTFANDTGAVTPADLRKDIEGLSKRIDGLESKLRTGDLVTILGAINSKLDAGGGAVESKAQAEELAKSIAAARRAVSELNAQLDRLQKSVDVVLGPSEGSKDTVAARPVGPSPDAPPVVQGKLILINSDPAAEKILYINGIPWQVRVGRSYITVPLGDVSIGSKGVDPALRKDWKKNPKSDRFEMVYEF